jgi:hypothetical protein
LSQQLMALTRRDSSEVPKMVWIVVSAVLGGLVVGFMAGASPTPTGGNTGAAVAALLLGVFALFGKDAPQSSAGIAMVGQLFSIFLACLMAAYIGANRLRARGRLSWMGLGPRHLPPKG